jgi:iron(III) transport system permease protein
VSSAVASPTGVRAGALRRRVAGARQHALALGLAALVTVLVLPPIAMVVYSSFVEGDDVWSGVLTLSNYETVFARRNGFALIRNTLIFAIASSVLSVGLAAVVGFLVERTNAPFRRLVYLSMIVAFGVPTVVQTIGWIFLIGPTAGSVNALIESVLGDGAPTINAFSMGGMIFVQTLIMFPAMFLLVAPTLKMADPALEQAALVGGAGRLRVLRTITLPLATPALLGAGLLAFINAIESFEVPGLMGTPGGIRVVSTSIYQSIRSFSPDFGSAAALSSLLMVGTIGGLLFYQRVTARAQRYATVTGKGYRPERLDLGRFRWVAGIVTVGIPLLIVAPVLMLAWASLLRGYSAPALDQISRFTLSNYSELLSSPEFLQAGRNSLILGIAAAILVMGLTLVISWAVIRRRSGLTRASEQLASLPLVVPGLVMSLALLRLFLGSPVPVYGTLWILVIAFLIYFIPYGLRYNHAGVIAVHAELEEAAEVSGAGRWQVFRHILVPLVRGTLLAGALFVFLASVRQLSLVVFITGADTNVVASAMFNMWNLGSITAVATGATLVVLVVTVVAVVLYRITAIGRRPDAGPVLQLR